MSFTVAHQAAKYKEKLEEQYEPHRNTERKVLVHS